MRYNEYRLQVLLEYEDIVCLNSESLPWVLCTLQFSWDTFLNRHRIRKVRIHDLSHTHATMLVLAGIYFKIISNRLGHTDIKITMNRYSHILEEMDRKSSENISNIMF